MNLRIRTFIFHKNLSTYSEFIISQLNGCFEWTPPVQNWINANFFQHSLTNDAHIFLIYMSSDYLFMYIIKHEVN